MDGYSLSDVAAVSKMGNGDSDNFLSGNGILIILFFLIILGGGSGFGLGGGDRSVTNAEFQLGLYNQTIAQKIDLLDNEVLNGFSQVGRDISDLGYKQQLCCCQLQRDGDANTRAILDKLCQMENTQKDFRISELETEVNLFKTTKNILDAQGRYVTNPPCNPCPCANGCFGC